MLLALLLLIITSEMNNDFTLKLKDWLETEPDKRDYAKGALLLLQLNGNQIMYRNLCRKLDKDVIVYNIQKYYNFRVKQLTHEQVSQMQEKVEEIVERNIPLSKKADESRKGKRDDHDNLPDEIKAKYVENLSLLRRMRELHLKLRSLSLTDHPCPDSERYPFLKEIISLDKKLHKNWQEYDKYIVIYEKKR